MILDGIIREHVSGKTTAIETCCHEILTAFDAKNYLYIIDLFHQIGELSDLSRFERCLIDGLHEEKRGNVI